jgi:hypothetical protein
MLVERKTYDEVRFSAPCASAEKQLIGFAVIGRSLRSRIGLPLGQPLLDGRDLRQGLLLGGR